MANEYQAAVVAAPGVVAQDGHEHFWSPRNIIAFLIITAMVANVFAPYFFPIPAGRSGDLIISGSKMLETVAMLVLAFYFATTKNSERQQETIRQQALNVPPAAPPPDPSTVIKVDPPATLDVKETPDANPDAARSSPESAGLSTAERVQPRDDGPPE